MKLKDICKFTTKGLNFAKNRKLTIISDFYEPAIYGSSSSWYYLTMSCIKDNYIGELCSFEENRDYAKYALRDGDIVLCKLGPYFRTAIYDNAFPFEDPDRVKSKISILVTENIYIIQVDMERIDPYYVAYFLSLKETKEKIKNIAKGERTKFIRIDDVLDLEIPEMTKEMRQATNEFKEGLLKMGREYREKNAKALELKNKRIKESFKLAEEVMDNAMENENKD